ncbi:MAG: hypothetical protein NXI10_05320 [bacterium]|nr:hypothetical protein [bacterium]
MKTLLSFVILSLIVISACSKNQRKVNRIDGKWNVVDADIQGYGSADPDVIYEFEFCKLRQDDYCDFSAHNFETDDLTTGVYRISDRGTTLEMTVSNGFGFEYREYTIIRMSPWRMVLEANNAPVGEFSRLVLRKVK